VLSYSDTFIDIRRRFAPPCTRDYVIAAISTGASNNRVMALTI
jgi:hypothetical protein